MIDLLIDENGDIVTKDGNFVYITGDRLIAQRIIFRLKTQRGDYLLAPNVGANLERFIGEPLNETTLDNVRREVENEISNIPEANVISVKTAPLGDNSILIAIRVESVDIPQSNLVVISSLDLKTGKIEARIAEW